MFEEYEDEELNEIIDRITLQRGDKNVDRRMTTSHTSTI